MKEHFSGFEKIHIANIASLIIDQGVCINLPIISFNERIDEADREFKQTVAKLVPSESVRKAIFNALLVNGSVARNVFFEAGILCGVKLARAQNADTDSYRELMRRYSEKTDQKDS